MQRLIVFLILSLNYGKIYAETPKSGQNETYRIVSNKLDETIPSGSAVLSGHLILPAGVDHSALTGFISTFDGQYRTNVDSLGQFALQIPAGVYSFYFFCVGWDELLVENFLFRDRHRVEICLFPKENQSQIMVEKPVIYLYHPDSIDVSIKLTSRSDLSFSYPPYLNGWNVNVCGNVISSDNKKYPYLFWESVGYGLNFSAQNGSLNASIVRTDTLVPFLEKYLGELGFTSNEKTDLFLIGYRECNCMSMYSLSSY